MANSSIPVTIDGSGNITCPDITASVGDQLTWVVTGGTISSITPGTPSPFSVAPASSRGVWSATVRSAGQYTLTDSVGKVRTPRIAVITPEPVKSK